MTYITFFPAVMIAAIVGGDEPGIFATVLSGACAIYFFVEPRYTFQVPKGADVLGLLLFLSMGLGISVLAGVAERSRRRLRMASQYARGLIETSLDPLVTISRDGQITDVNQATVEATGVPLERLIGSDFCEYFSEPGKAQQGYQQAFAQGMVRDYPLTMRHSNGRITDVLYNASTFKNQAGKIEGVSAAARDVTEIQRVAREIRRSEDKYRTLLENIPQKIVYKDRNSVFISCNENYARDLHIAPDEIAGKTDYDFYPAELAERYRNDDRNVMESGEAAQLEEQYVQDGKYIWVNTVKTPVRDAYFDEGGRLVRYIGATLDITERKNAEDALRKHRDELETRCRSGSPPAVSQGREATLW